MGKGMAGDRDPLDAIPVPESRLDTRELLARDIGFAAHRDAGGGFVRLRHHALPEAWREGSAGEPALWRVAHPYPRLSGPGTTLLGGLVLLGADRLLEHEDLAAHGQVHIDGRACSRLWAFTFEDGATSGIDLREPVSTACTCDDFGELRVCPHQAFAVFYVIAGLVAPAPSTRVRADDGEVNRLAAWLAMRDEGVASGDLLADAVTGYYDAVRAHPFTVVIDAPHVEAAIRPPAAP